tara:strand:- start:322 stop:489 length:168 start_codon:yes stop_codon:yes gene_type:complete
MSDEGSAYLAGLITMAILALMVWHIAEGACQATHDVYDCEWTQSPFTPFLPETLD